MANYPGAETERRVPQGALLSHVSRIFDRCGMSVDDAHLLADSLVWADLRGIHSHGVLRVPEYVEKLKRGGVNPKGRPVLAKDHRAAFVVDGGNSMGAIGAAFAMHQAIDRASLYGVAAGAVRASNHCGPLSFYAVRALSHNMIGIATTNALPTMAPWGGKDKIVGINPLAVAVPTHLEPPIVLDCAFSYSSHGKIRVFNQKGAAIPPTWAFDTEGHPTTDVTKALEGLLQPIGEYKGVGLAIVMGILSSLLSGASYGTELGNMVDGPHAGQDGHFVAAINIAAFEDARFFRDRADKIVHQIQKSRPIAPGTPLYAPGGLEAEIEDRNRVMGIPLNQQTLDGLMSVAVSLGVSLL